MNPVVCGPHRHRWVYVVLNSSHSLKNPIDLCVVACWQTLSLGCCVYPESDHWSLRSSSSPDICPGCPDVLLGSRRAELEGRGARRTTSPCPCPYAICPKLGIPSPISCFGCVCVHDMYVLCLLQLSCLVTIVPLTFFLLVASGFSRLVLFFLCAHILFLLRSTLFFFYDIWYISTTNKEMHAYLLSVGRIAGL